MNILYIWDADYPWDVRVEKICNGLKNNGHHVHIAARNLKKKPVLEKINNITIHRMKPWKNSRLNYFFSFPLFFSPIWKSFLDKIIQENAIQLIIVRDLPLAIAGISAGRRNGNIPVIFDMAEDYVSMIKDIWKLRKFKGLNLIVRNPYLAKYVAKYVFKHSDHILVVVNEAKDVVIKGGGNLNKITVVSNTPKLDVFDKITQNSNDYLQKIKRHYAAIYTGGIQLGRGIQIVLDAVPIVVEKIPDFLFVVIGDGYATKTLKNMIKEKGLEKYVLWIGWVEHSELFAYIKASRLGIIPHKVSEHVKTTIPNKIFDYMGCGIPVVSSDAPPMKNLLNEENAGLSFKSGDPLDLASKIIAISDSNQEYGTNGKKAILRKYNWQIDEENLLQVVANYES